jgi:hypothetical protein
MPFMRSDTKEIAFIRDAINNLGIDLGGLTVLTEIGSNYYFFLPFIAALAGAEKVYAWTAENSYFNCSGLVEEAKALSIELGLDDKIGFAINERPAGHVRAADIITNSGFIRPLNEDILRHCKDKAVIPLMFEAWELRESDIDMNYCRQKKIKVAGTWESHPSISVFESVGPLAVKLAFEAGMEVYQNRILVWSDDAFGAVSADYFRKMNAKEVLQTTDKAEALEYLPYADFIYFCPNHEKRFIISNIESDAVFTIDELKKANPWINIVHLYGKFNMHELEINELTVYPKQNGKAEYMSKTLTHIGMRPTLNLLCAGLKVGELLHAGVSSELVQLIP